MGLVQDGFKAFALPLVPVGPNLLARGRRLRVRTFLVDGLAGRGRHFALQGLAVADDDGVFDDVFQLADVARPGVDQQPRQAARMQAPVRAPQAAREALPKVVGQSRNVLRPLAQGRQGNGEDVEAVVGVPLD